MSSHLHTNLELQSSNKSRANPAKIKIAIIVCFYLFVALYTVVTLNEIDPFIMEVTHYYLCEANGV